MKTNYPQCDIEVRTYHWRGIHRCHRRAKTVVNDVRLCGFHAYAQQKREEAS